MNRRLDKQLATDEITIDYKSTGGGGTGEIFLFTLILAYAPTAEHIPRADSIIRTILVLIYLIHDKS
jgi:hypothetical protein